MESRIYYGEYSLKHWIDLILSRNIVLPDYQRSFVWNETDIIRLLKSFKEHQFVQPVTIALYKFGPDYANTNLILDGQQRLTSILLAYLGVMLDTAHLDCEVSLCSDDDSSREEIQNAAQTTSFNWTFQNICKKQTSNQLFSEKQLLLISAI